MQRFLSNPNGHLVSQNADVGCRLATIAGANAVSIAALYLGQVLTKIVASDFPETPEYLALIPGATLAGYAAGVGIIVFAPAGRGGLSVTAQVGLLATALCAAGLAPNAATLAIASFAIGGGAAVAQRLLAAAGRLGGVTHGGAFIAWTICAALTAVLGVRVAGEGLAQVMGWRTIFFGAAATAGVLGILSHALLAGHAPLTATTAIPSSISPLWRRSALFRWAVFQHGAMFAAYNLTWLTILVEIPPADRGLIVIGGSGVGIVAALLAGYCIDRFNQRDLARYGAGTVAVATALVLPLAYRSSPGPQRALMLLLGMALLDGGLQTTLVANQARVQLLLPEARSRVAALLTVCGSLGGAVGAGIGYWCWYRFGWQAAIGLAAVCGQAALGCAILAKSKRLNTSAASDDHGPIKDHATVAYPADWRRLRPLASAMPSRKKTRTA